MLFVVIAQLIGEEAVLLGAFLIGLVISSMLHRERSVMLLKLDGMGYGFFIPFFFIMVGVEFDPSALMEFSHSLIWFLMLLMISLFAVKIIPALLWRRLFGARKAMAGGFLMSSRLSLIIAASAIGLQMGVISPGINASFIIMAIVTCFLAPVIFNGLSPASMLSGEKTFIVGGSNVGVFLAERLGMYGKKSIIIENNTARAEEISAKGLHCVKGDGTDAGIYRELKLNPSDYVIVETGSPQKNHEVCRLLRNVLLHENIITRASTADIEQKLTNMGVKTIDVISVLATTIESLVLRPTTYRTLVESFENYRVEEILITCNDVDGLQVKEIPFHKDAILIMVKRGNSFFIPHGETYFRRGDTLLVFGTNTALQNTQEKMR
jgi:Trk K+ transport system NAD-binding subunit